MTQTGSSLQRTARTEDGTQLLRLANVITLAEHRGHGHGTTLVLDIVAWAQSIDADRVDLSATPAGQRIYEKLGFTVTAAPA